MRQGHFVAHREESHRQPLIGATAMSLRAERSNLCSTQRLLRRLWLLAMTEPHQSFFRGMTPALAVNQVYGDGTAERGAALVTVLLAITLLTIVVVEFAYSTQIDHHLAYNSLRSLQA